MNIGKVGLQGEKWEDIRDELGVGLASLCILRQGNMYHIYSVSQHLPHLLLFNTCVCPLSICWIDEWVTVEQAACKSSGGSIVCLQYQGPAICNEDKDSGSQ